MVGGRKEPRESKNLRPRPSAHSANLDVLIAVDGSGSITADDFIKEKQLCNALAARLGEGSQLGVLQFGSTAKVIANLTTNRPELEAKVDGMTQIGGGTNLLQAMNDAYQEFALTRRPTNTKQLWVITDGDYENISATALAAQKLAREKQVTIYAVGVGNKVTLAALNRVASVSCSYLVKDFDSAAKVLNADGQKDLSVQLNADLVFQEPIPLRLGQEAILKVEVTNVGKRKIPANSRILFKGNDYFREKYAIIPDEIPIGREYTLEQVKLVPKIKGNKSNLDAQILAVPAVLEVSVSDDAGNDVYCDCTGFFINHEDFSGDIYSYAPVFPEIPQANVITFGPPGAGKSSFVNSVISSLGDHIANLNVAGATRDVVTSTLVQFPLNRLPSFQDIKFALYDIPGLDGKNYQGEELALLMYGLMPFEIDFKHNATRYQTVRGHRSTPEEEFRRQAHVVAFFVPQGVAGDSDVMNRLANCLKIITVDHKRKAIVIISHADEVPAPEDRKVIQEDVCNALSIDGSSVFFLENYVDTKDKQFNVDKNVLRILLAMIYRADDFMCYDRLNPIVCPFENNPHGRTGGSTMISSPVLSPVKPEPVKPEPVKSSPKVEREKPSQKPAAATVKGGGSPAQKPKPAPVERNYIDDFLDKLPDTFRDSVRIKLEEEAIDDEETIKSMTADDWRNAGFKLGDIKKIQKALAEE